MASATILLVHATALVAMAGEPALKNFWTALTTVISMGLAIFILGSASVSRTTGVMLASH